MFRIIMLGIIVTLGAYIVNDFSKSKSDPKKTTLESAYWEKGDEYQYCIAQGWGKDDMTVECAKWWNDIPSLGREVTEMEEME
tara:strand:+ start:302 stop:550 length:249 start_codon:yes stop_codon:yes gene_type:complete